MKIQLEPMNKFSSASKLAMILHWLEWEASSHNPDVKLWITDAAFDDSKFYNWRKRDMNKRMLNEAFESVFGYRIGIDPQRHVGPAVEKPLGHGIHGKVVQCPKCPVGDMAYQLLLSNRNDGWTDEYRLDIFCNEIIVTLKHQKLQRSGIPQERRTDGSSEYDLVLGEHFYPQEQRKIVEFCKHVGMDYGSLDAIRHRDGRLYIIDATCNVGVPEMSWHRNLTMDKYLERQAQAFERNFSKT